MRVKVSCVVWSICIVLYLNFGTLSHLLLLRYGIGDDYGLEVGVVDARDRVAAEYAVCADGVDLGGAGLVQLLGGQAERAARVGHVVD